MDNRAPGSFLVDHGLDGAQGVFRLLLQRLAATRHGGGEHVTHVVQAHHRVAHALVGDLSQHVSGFDRHGEFVLGRKWTGLD